LTKRRQRAEGRRQKGFIPMPKAQALWRPIESKGFKPPVNFVHWLVFRRGLNPILKTTFCPLPPAFCLFKKGF
jgi:hypothetical protein